MPIKDPEKRKAYAKAYRKKEADRIRRLCKEWRERDPEHAKELARQRSKKHRLLSPDKCSAKRKRYIDSDPDRYRKLGKEYCEAHREDRNAAKHKRRVKEHGNGGHYTASQWRALKKKHGFCCLRCKKHESVIIEEQGKGLTADHVVPVSKGGSGSIDNIQPLCGRCNSIKNVKSTDYR